MRFVVGQVPARELVLTVTDDRAQVDPLSYDAVHVLLRNPEGVSVSTSGGTTTVSGGKVRYGWPAVSLFATPGDYSLVLRCEKGLAVDFTEALILEVYREGA